MAIAIGLGGFSQGVDLAGCQVFSRAKLNVRSPCRRNCSKNSVGASNLSGEFSNEIPSS